MDEYNSGMEPEVSKFFRKIINSLSFLVLWLIFVLGIGLFFELGSIVNKIEWYNILYYSIALVGFVFLIRYLKRTWNK